MGELTFLLDTNVIAEPMRQQPDKQTLRRIRQYQYRIAVSSVTWHELSFGVTRMVQSARRRELEVYLNQGIRAEVPILPYDEAAAAWHAQERARLSARGKPPTYADAQIAAIAATQQLILVTRNVADFALFANLQVVNWHG